MARGKEFREAVLAYKYTSPTLSILERLFLNDFWTSVAEFYPRWLAPNLITLAGYCCVWAAWLLTLTYSPKLQGECPGWVYLVNAFLFWAYQTLDGSDGKQARRTKSGSALGELMDHGVDAVVTTLLALLVADVFGFGITSIWPWSFVAVGTLSFFLSNMTLVHSGRQMFFDVDVMEIQTVMINTLIIAGTFGVGVFDSFGFPLPEMFHDIKTNLGGILQPGEEIDFTNGQLPLKLFIAFGGFIGTGTNYPQYIFATIKPYFLSKENQPIHIQNKVEGSGFMSALYHLFLIHLFTALLICGILLGINLAPSGRSEAVMRAYAFIVSFSFGDLMDRVLLMRVAREPLPFIIPGILNLALFSLCAFFDQELQSLEQSIPILDQLKWWRIVGALSFIAHHSYFARAVIDLSKVLEIHPFRVRKQPQEKKEK